MFLSLKKLFLNASLVALIIGFCCDAYLYAGYVTFMSKYLEIQFNLTAYAANIFSGQYTHCCTEKEIRSNTIQFCPPLYHTIKKPPSGLRRKFPIARKNFSKNRL